MYRVKWISVQWEHRNNIYFFYICSEASGISFFLWKRVFPGERKGRRTGGWKLIHRERNESREAQKTARGIIYVVWVDFGAWYTAVQHSQEMIQSLSTQQRRIDETLLICGSKYNFQKSILINTIHFFSIALLFLSCSLGHSWSLCIVEIRKQY